MYGNLVTVEQKDELEKLYKPLMEYLAKNFHPHVKVIVTNTSAEFVEGQASFHTTEFVETKKVS